MKSTSTVRELAQLHLDNDKTRCTMSSGLLESIKRILDSQLGYTDFSVIQKTRCLIGTPNNRISSECTNLKRYFNTDSENGIYDRPSFFQTDLLAQLLQINRKNVSRKKNVFHINYTDYFAQACSIL